MKLKTVSFAVVAGAAAALMMMAPSYANGGHDGGPGDDGSTQKGLVAVDDVAPIQVCQSEIPVAAAGLASVLIPVEVPIDSPQQTGACANNGSNAESEFEQD
ncbi:MAG: hypothetical protein HOQ05_02480 [Corynebacteriales bacterium]|nr:hypothetical protein [Mycobacteriales bacterium]